MALVLFTGEPLIVFLFLGEDVPGFIVNNLIVKNKVQN